MKTAAVELIAKLSVALNEYAQHQRTCPVHAAKLTGQPFNEGENGVVCTCGLTATVARLKAEECPHHSVPRAICMTCEDIDLTVLAVKLDELNEATKEVGNALWVRGIEYQELADGAYKAAKQIWITQGMLRAYLRRLK